MEHKTIKPSPWPIVASIAMLLLALGAVDTIQGGAVGLYLLSVGLVMMIGIVYGWFKDAIYDHVDDDAEQLALSEKSYRLSMGWFIFTELMLFLTFFAVLFYARYVSVPWLSGFFGQSASQMTHKLIWPDFQGVWPLIETVPDPSKFTAPRLAMVAWGIPTINTAILLLSGLTITLAHGALIRKNKPRTLFWQASTIVLGLIFVVFQAYEYIEAYQHYGLRFESGIYGNVFYLLTGFHGFHVLLGALMLVVIWFRLLKGSIFEGSHFSFEAVSWYWHFVDVVWLFLFVFVYWL